MVDLARIRVFVSESVKRFDTLAANNNLAALRASDRYHARVGREIIAEIDRHIRQQTQTAAAKRKAEEAEWENRPLWNESKNDPRRG